MAKTLSIQTILNHLAWLREQLGCEINRHNAPAAALLAYNAAARLQWHFVFPHTDDEWISDADDRKRAAKLIDDFVWEIRELHQEAMAADKSERPSIASARTMLGRLETQLTKLLRRLPKLAAISDVIPVRQARLEEELRPVDLMRAWIYSRRASLSARPTSSHAGTPEPKRNRSGLLAALAGVAFVQEPRQGAGEQRTAAASTDIVDGLLKFALSEHVAELPDRAAERTIALGRDIAAQLTRR